MSNGKLVDESHLLLAEYAAKKPPERVVVLLLWLVHALLAAAIVFAPLISIAEDLVGVGDVVELLLRVFVSGVSVRMVLQRQLSVGLLNVSSFCILLELENCIEVSARVFLVSGWAPHHRVPEQGQHE